MKRACLLIVFAALASLSLSAYDNDGPNFDPKAPKRVRLMATSESFKPPEPSDVCFVATSGGDLGKEVWGKYSSYSPNGSISIPLPIKRYFGEKEKLIKSKALPETVTLTMVVWDVDDKSSYAPAEYDEIFVNGRPPKDKKTLYGVNNGLHMNTFTIDINDIKLPTKAGATAENIIRIDVATKGGDWVTRIDWVALEIPAAPPVLLAHGIRSDKDTLDEIQDEIEDLGLPVRTFSFSSNGNDGISAGANQMVHEIADMREKLNVDTINIVAHSMGGLKAREYVERYGNPRTHKTDVKKVLQIATPNAGSPLADTALMIRGVARESSFLQMILRQFASSSDRALLNNGRALDELSTSYMNEYNENHPLKSGVDFGIVAGNVTSFGKLDFASEFLYDMIEGQYGENDTIVPVSSAFALPMKKKWKRSDSCDVASHGGLVDDGARTTVMLLRGELVERKTVSEGSDSTSAKMPVNTRALMSAAPFSDAGSMVVSGRCLARKEAEIPFHVAVGGKVSGWLCVDGCGAVTAMLCDAKGAVLDAVIKSEGGLCMFDASGLTPGKVYLKFTPTEADVGNVGYLGYVFVAKEQGVNFSLNASLQQKTVSVGQSFSLVAAPEMNGRRISGEILVNVMQPDGEVVSYQASQMSTGEYRTVIPSHAAGDHVFSITFDAAAPEAFSRTYVLRGSVHESASRFAGVAASSVADEDQNGLYDSLTVNFAVNVTKAGTYRVLATLADVEGHEITKGWTGNIGCSVGTHMFPVTFDGHAIYENGECGGYVVSSLKLLEIGNDYEAVIDERVDFFTTRSYTYRQFEHAMVGMRNGGSDIAVDSNGDGVYDRLDVTLQLYADDLASGSYEWSASLMDADGILLGTASGNVTFASGQGGASISMSFDSDGIVATHKDGKYIVKNLILWGNGRNFTVSGEYSTASYRIADFGGELATSDLGFYSPAGWSDSLVVSTNSTGTTSMPSFEEGDTIYLNYAFANVANGAAVGNFVNRFTLSNGGSCSDSWVGYTLGEGNWGWLGEGFAPAMLQNLSPGTYTLTCELDADGQLPETDEYNNVIETTFVVNATTRPNLKIAKAVVSKRSITLSESAVIHWRADNDGVSAAGKTKTAFQIWKYDSSEETWILKKTDWLDCNPLAAGAGREYVRTVTGKSLGGVGDYIIRVWADGKDSIREKDESDNYAQTYILTVSKDISTRSSSGVDWQFKKLKSVEPDSFFLSASASMKKKATTFKVGQTIYMRRAFWNAKKRAVNGEVTSRYWLNGTYSESSTESSYIGARTIVYNTANAPSFLQNLPAGKYTLTAIIDSNNSWQETNEKNNVRRISFTVVGTPEIYGETAFTCALNEPVSWPVSSEGTMTVKGLPPGMKYSGGAIVGKATKTGTYSAKFAAKNAAGTKSRTIKIAVVNPGFSISVNVRANGATGEMSVTTGETIPMFAGVVQNISVSSTPGKAGIAKSGASSVTATGLPPGLKFANGVISGAPSKIGTYTVQLVFKNALGWTKSFAMKMTVKPLPAFARGTFNGWSYYYDDSDEDGRVIVRKMALSVTSAGKMSATVGSLKFTGTGWTVDDDGSYLANLRTVRTVGTGKKAKKYTDVLSIWIDPNRAWTDDQLGGCVATFSGSISLADALEPLNGLESVLTPMNTDTYVSARRNPFGDNDEAKAIAATLVAQGTHDFTDDAGLAWKVKMAANGVATISRTTGSGKNRKTTSATAVLEVEDDGAGDIWGVTRFLVSGKIIKIEWGW